MAGKKFPHTGSSPGAHEGILAPRYRSLTIALITLITIAAFDETAVMSVMPSITSDLGASGGAGYTLTFTAVTAASIFAMVAGGMLADSRGAMKTLRWAGVIFVIGLLLSVVAPTMTIFLISRVLQGIGGGAVVVAIYAIIAVTFPARLQTKMFAALAGAWVIPTLVGPGVAGVITESLSWHWLFGISAAASIAVFPFLPAAAAPVTADTKHPNAITMLIAALVVAVSSYPLTVSSNFGLWGIMVFLAATGVTLVAIKPLVPSGTFRAAGDIPSLILLRFLFDGFFGLEALIPLLLARRDGLPPTLTGLALTGTGLTWFIGSHLQSQREPKPLPATLWISAAFMGTSALGVGISSALGAHWLVITAFWTICGFGIGYSYPRINAAALSLAPTDKAGFTGSALQVSGMTGMTMTVAAATLVHTLVPLPTGGAFGVVYIVAVLPPVLIALIVLKCGDVDKAERHSVVTTT
ncbi:MFS transporter [Corynebacterium kroppenstedtii]|uniref:MFS transporter n=1 Tax=Corynebacterium sp. PCR 32 TaxID=3351342 RepID=UPI0030B48F5E